MFLRVNAAHVSFHVIGRTIFCARPIGNSDDQIPLAAFDARDGVIRVAVWGRFECFHLSFVVIIRQDRLRGLGLFRNWRQSRRRQIR